MGFSAMKLINEAGIRGTAVISVAQPSARSPVSSSNEGMGPFNTAAFPGGPEGQAGPWALVYFLAELPRASRGSLAGIYPRRGKKKKKGERGWGTGSFLHRHSPALLLSLISPGQPAGRARTKSCLSW